MQSNLIRRTRGAATPIDGGNHSGTAFRSINLNQEPSNSVPAVLDLRRMGATSGGRPSPFPNSKFKADTRSTGRPFSRPGPKGRGPRPGGLARRRSASARKYADEEDAADAEKGPSKSPAEIAYEKQKELERTTAKPAKIDVPTPETLLGLCPRVALGDFGTSAIVHGSLMAIAESDHSRTDSTRIFDLAGQLLEGSYVYFRSAEEKEAVLGMAYRRATKRAQRLSEKKSEVVEAEEPGFEGLSEEDRNAFVNKLLEGKYSAPVDPAQKGLLRNIIRQTRRNETYFGKDEASLARKLQPMLPVPRAQVQRARAKATT